MSKTFILIIAIIVIVGGIFWWQKDNINKLIFGEEQKACTMEAKICSDGSYVGRTGPNCEFAACPEDATADWQTYRNEEYGFEVKYPLDWEVSFEVSSAFNQNSPNQVSAVKFVEKGSNMWPGDFSIQLFSNGEKLLLDQWIEKYQPKDPVGNSLITKKEDIMFSGVAAKKLEIFSFDHADKSIITSGNGYIYNLIFESENPNDPDIELHKIITNQILSTFKFIE